MSEIPSSKLAHLQHILRQGHQKLNRRKPRILITTILGFALGLWGIFAFLEHRFYLEPIVKAIFWLILFCGVGSIGWHLSRLLQSHEFRGFYQHFSKKSGLKALRDALDLADNPRNQTSEFLPKAIAQNLAGISEDHTKNALETYLATHESSAWQKQSFVAFLLGSALFLLSFFTTDGTTQRLFAFWQTFDKPNPFEFVLSPEDATREQGSIFRVEVTFTGSTQPQNVTLSLKTDVESDFRSRRMRQAEDDTWVSDGIELFNNLSYYLVMDGYRTREYHVEVQLIPRFQDLVVTVTPPSYTRLPEQKFSYPFNRVEAFQGSEITLQATSNKEIQNPIAFLHHTADSLQLTGSGTDFSGSFSVMKNDSLSFKIRDFYGLQNRNPFTFRVIALEDQKPLVRILQPQREKSGMTIDSLQIVYGLEDDFGFSSVRLRYELLKAFTDQPQTGHIRLPVPRQQTGVYRYTWHLNELNLSSMDELTYWIEASDNDAVNGFKTGRSERHILRIQSLADFLFEQDEKEQAIARNMEQAEERMARMQQSYERLREQIRDTPREHWEQSQTLEAIEEQRKELEEQIQALQEQFEELRREMEQDGGLSEETMERYRELQELMQEIDDPDILRMLEEMRENLENMNQQQLRQALDNLEFNEERYRERLERTVELFKQLKLNSDLDKATRLLDELQSREEALTKAEEYGDREIEQQQQIQRELEDLAKRLDQLPENSPRRQQQRMEDLNQQMQQQLEETTQETRDNIRQMQEGQPQQNIRQQQQNIQQQLQQMSSQLSSAREQMNQEQVSINILALKNILQSVIMLSEEQEDILQQTSGLRDQSGAFVSLARRQRNVYVNFSAVADSLNQVAREIPQFTSRILTRRAEVERQMDRAVDTMRERQRNNSTVAARFSMSGLNEIGTMLADLIDQLQQQSGGGGGGGMSAQQMMQQMQDMSGQQQQLNQQIQDMINDLQGERLTQDSMERLNQLARQQNQIREQLRNLQRSGAFESGDSILSELERMAEEMEDAINDLRGGATDPLMVQRQQNILSRMLEAERSLQERDEEEERRRGETPEEFDISRAPALTMEELEQRIRNSLQDPNQTRFNPDYQRLIERYFELLREARRQAEESF